MKGKAAAVWAMAAGVMVSLAIGLSFPAVAEEEDTQEKEMPVEMEKNLRIVPGARIAVVAKTTSGSFWKNLEKGMNDAVSDINQLYGLEKEEKLTMTFEGPSEETEVTNQINMIDAVLSENPAVLCLSASDMESCEAQLENAAENGIPVIMFDSDVQSDLYTGFCGTDNRKAAAMAADKLTEAMGEKGKIAVFAHQGKTRTSSERVEQFKEEIRKYPDMEIAGILYQDEEEDMKAAMTDFLDTHEDVEGVFCTNGEMADLFLEVQKNYEDRAMSFVGVDASPAQQKAVSEGRELGIVAQQPYMLGYQTVCEAVRALSGASVKRETLLDTAWIDQNTLENPDYAQYLEE